MATTRRDFIKSNAIAAAATSAGMTVPSVVMSAAPQGADGVRWDKGACTASRAISCPKFSTAKTV